MFLRPLTGSSPLGGFTRALLALLLVVAGCGGGEDRTKAHVRLVNASSGYSSLEMRVDDELRQSDVGYGATESYVDVKPADAETSISRAGAATALITFTPSVSKNKHYTVLAYGAAGALKQQLLDEDTADPANDRSLLRVVNTSPDAGPVDIYLIGNNESLDDAVPVQTAAAVGSIGGWITVTSGSWRLAVTATGSKTDVRLNVSSLTLASKQIATLVVSTGPGGVLLRGLLLNQQGGIAQLGATQARVRGAAAVAAAGAVTLKVGATTLLAGVSSPAVTRYSLVDVGTVTVKTAVNGVDQADVSVRLDAGGDYTLLVYGTPASPLPVVRLVDTNSVATDSTKARVRLVNAMADLTTPLTLTVDSEPLADSVNPGTASDYQTLAATTTGKVAVTAAGLASALFGASDQTFTAGGTYTVFVGGTAAAPQGVVRKDQ